MAAKKKAAKKVSKNVAAKKKAAKEAAPENVAKPIKIDGCNEMAVLHKCCEHTILALPIVNKGCIVKIDSAAVYVPDLSVRVSTEGVATLA